MKIRLGEALISWNYDSGHVDFSNFFFDSAFKQVSILKVCGILYSKALAVIREEIHPMNWRPPWYNAPVA
jgi:hypothetical protein